MTTGPASKSAGLPSAVDAFMAGLEHPHKDGIEVLRRTILGADDRITEEIKWNAPSFKVTDHFLTFKLYPPKSIQLIFHVGAKPVVPARKFTLDLPPAMVKWPATDRCVLTIADSSQVDGMTASVVHAVKQWLAQLHP